MECLIELVNSRGWRSDNGTFKGFYIETNAQNTDESMICPLISVFCTLHSTSFPEFVCFTMYNHVDNSLYDSSKTPNTLTT